MGVESTFSPSGRVSQPSRLALITLRELFPTTPASTFRIHSDIKCNGGSCSPGDLVAVWVGEHGLHVGELITTVDVGAASLVAIVSLWEAMGDIDSIGWRQYKVSEDNVAKVPSTSLDTVLLFCMSKDRDTCLVYLPYELRA